MPQPVSVRGVSSSHELRRQAVTNGERAGIISNCIDHLPSEVDFFVSHPHAVDIKGHGESDRLVDFFGAAG
mgnify:CR=1 FL=1